MQFERDMQQIGIFRDMQGFDEICSRINMGFAVEYGFAMWHIASNTSDGWKTHSIILLAEATNRGN